MCDRSLERKLRDLGETIDLLVSYQSSTTRSRRLRRALATLIGKDGLELEVRYCVGGVISLLWGTLGKFFPALSKSRGSMDPDGSPAPASTTTSGNDGDSRGSMDPDG